MTNLWEIETMETQSHADKKVYIPNKTPEMREICNTSFLVYVY